MQICNIGFHSDHWTKGKVYWLRSKYYKGSLSNKKIININIPIHFENIKFGKDEFVEFP